MEFFRSSRPLWSEPCYSSAHQEAGCSGIACLERTLQTRMKKIIVSIIVLVAACVSSRAHSPGEWVPSDDFLRAVRFIESGGGVRLVGDRGMSLGAYQLSEAAWLDVNEWRKQRGLKLYHYPTHVMNPFVNRAYAANYFSVIHSEISRKLRRPPTHEELYVAYNIGLGTFARCEFRVNRVNSTTRGKALQIETMIGCHRRCS
jgi:hypothetical protein